MAAQVPHKLVCICLIFMLVVPAVVLGVDDPFSLISLYSSSQGQRMKYNSGNSFLSRSKLFVINVSRMPLGRKNFMTRVVRRD